MPYTYEWPRPSVTVDALIFTRGAKREVLLIQRKGEPFKGRWAIPGGFVDMDEDLEPAAHRELEEETGLRGVKLEQFRTYGTPSRDPRGRTISVVYVGEVDAKPAVKAQDDAAAARFWPLDGLPEPLAFDHDTILKE
ncbi:MAG TPA: NUDIX hydrolase, partial [Planctomycetota bacterium]|nr:NUDIX hydrolase [Planctomycetota bacterium]